MGARNKRKPASIAAIDETRANQAHQLHRLGALAASGNGYTARWCCDLERSDMLYLLLGLLGFLGLHSVRVFAPSWREAKIAAWGLGRWKLIYSVLSLLTFVLLIWGYGAAKQTPMLIWAPPPGLRHAAALLTLPAFILLIAAYFPGNHLKAKLGHPMILAVKLWAFAHLLVNGWLHAMLLFGAFLIWAIIDFRSARRRPPGPALPPPNAMATVLTVVIGIAAWLGFALYAHVRLMGVAPFGVSG
jgi:NnrU protein